MCPAPPRPGLDLGLQTAVDKVSLEQLDTEAPRPPRSLRLQEMQLLGLDISRGLLLVYDGYRAEVRPASAPTPHPHRHCTLRCRSEASNVLHVAWDGMRAFPAPGPSTLRIMPLPMHG